MTSLRWTPLLAALILCSSCSIGGGSTSPTTALGAPESTFNGQWDVDPTSAACYPENLDTTCHYLRHGVHITVSFDRQHHAEQIVVDGRRHPSVNMWHFLTDLVPAGSHRVSCKDVSRASWGGVAHACIYHGKRDIIVARFAHPNDPGYGGLVAYDYAGYRDVKPEDRPSG